MENLNLYLAQESHYIDLKHHYLRQEPNLNFLETEVLLWQLQELFPSYINSLTFVILLVAEFSTI